MDQLWQKHFPWSFGSKRKLIDIEKMTQQCNNDFFTAPLTSTTMYYIGCRMFGDCTRGVPANNCLTLLNTQNAPQTMEKYHCNVNVTHQAPTLAQLLLLCYF